MKWLIAYVMYIEPRRRFVKVKTANPTQSFRADRVESEVNNETKQAIALEITKMKMTAIYEQDSNLGINADLWVDEFHAALGRINEAEKNYARDKTKNRHSEF